MLSRTAGALAPHRLEAVLRSTPAPWVPHFTHRSRHRLAELMPIRRASQVPAGQLDAPVLPEGCGKESLELHLDDTASTAPPSTLPTPPAGLALSYLLCDLHEQGYLADIEMLCDADDAYGASDRASREPCTPPASPLDVAELSLVAECLLVLPQRRLKPTLVSRVVPSSFTGGRPRTPPNSPATASSICVSAASSPTSIKHATTTPSWLPSSAEFSSLPCTPPNSPRDRAVDLGRMHLSIMEGLDEAVLGLEQVHRRRLHKVIELLFSKENLRRDHQLRCRMDPRGWVPAVDVLRLLELRGLPATVADVLAAARLSASLQLSAGGRRLRARDPDIWEAFTSDLVEPSWPPHLAGGACHFEVPPSVSTLGPRRLREHRPGGRKVPQAARA